MSVLIHQLFFLPIHQQSYDQYYENSDKKVDKMRKVLEKQWDKPFHKIDHNIRIRCEEDFASPPWKFNNIVGFLEVGTDGGDCLTADIYLKRKHFPRSSRKRNKYHTPSKKQEFVFYSDVDKIKINVDNNDSYISGTKRLLLMAEKIIKKRNRNYKLWLPDFNLKCFNFVEACKMLMTK